jgi:hypothetical protein
MRQESTPTLGSKSFSCPHCGAISHQNWYKPYGYYLEDDEIPNNILNEAIEIFQSSAKRGSMIDEKSVGYARNILSGRPFFQKAKYENGDTQIGNLWISRCYSCKAICVWVHDHIVYPEYKFPIKPNADLPDEIKTDFTEAAAILALSPRGSAALLRLCIQKLCLVLGKRGRDLNADIAALVRDGLDERLQKALDIVRVIGNNAVHPGQMDLSDDMETASHLFRIVNMIADRMITQPRHIDELYDGLPQETRENIDQRNKKALSERGAGQQS